MNGVSAMILAGGRGGRMGILCQGRAKPNLSFAGNFRVIDFVLTNCVRSGIRDIAVLTDYQRSSMADYSNRWWFANGNRGTLHVLDPQRGSYKGTADAIYQNVNHLRKQGGSSVLILAADHIYKMDYNKMLAFHCKVDADVTIGVVSVPIEQAHRFGIVRTNAEGRVMEFVEKPKTPRSNLVSMGIYVFRRGILLERLAEDAAYSSSPHDFGHAIIPTMVGRDKVFAYRFNDYWRDIGTVEAYHEANMELVRQPLAFSLNSRWSILTQNFGNLPPPKISGQGNVRDSLVSPSCVVKGEVRNSILSPGVTIEDKAVVRNSVIMSGAVVGEHSLVENSILDEGVKVGKFCYVGLETSRTAVDPGVTVVGRDVAVPSYTAVCNGCRVSAEASPPGFARHIVQVGSAA